MKTLFDSLSKSGIKASTFDSVEHDLLVILQSVRKHFQMDVGFISEFVNGNRVFRYVDAVSLDVPVRVGGFDPLEDSYCQRVTDGRLPELIVDASQIPEAAALPATAQLPVGSHLSVPIRLSDGTLYGTFCCFSHIPDRTLNERDRSLLYVCAELAADRITQGLNARREFDETSSRIESVLHGNDISIVYQPIYHLIERRITGLEALSRFSAQPSRTPDLWFNEAAAVGLGEALELKAMKLALAQLGTLPPNVYMAVNVSPETILDDGFAEALANVPLARVVLEITEHHSIEDYKNIGTRLQPFRERGLRIAVDDAGAGYSSFRHILNLMPELIKLDISLTQHINSDESRRALAASLIRFAEETGSSIIAEGVETKEELDALHELGVTKVQGYYVGRPLPLPAAMATGAQARIHGID